MKALEAKSIYEEQWCQDFESMEKLYVHIKTLSQNGAYELCIYIDNQKMYDKVKNDLKENGYNLEDYNGGGNNILQISW